MNDGQAMTGRNTIIVSLGIALALPGAALAEQATLQQIAQEVASLQIEAEGLGQNYLKDESASSGLDVEKRVADGELYFRLGDFQRAAVIFLDIVDKYPDHTAYPNAMFMLAESMFNAKDLYGARTRYIQVLEHAGEKGWSGYQEPSLARLLEVSMKLEDFEGVEQYFSSLDTGASAGMDAVISYTKGKYFFFKDDMDTALKNFAAVPKDDAYHAQSIFFMGVIYAVKKDWASAASLFEEISEIEADDPRSRKIRDLAKLNLGRIYYETDQLERAAEVYESIVKTSEMFDQALYEAAWVYIKMEDPTKAERALEVLSISNPESPLIPEAQILRGNLLLRNGEYDEALKVFKDVSKQFGPVQAELEVVFAEHDDPQAYFHGLVAENEALFDTSSYLPPLALKWVDANPDTDRGVQVLEDLGICDAVLGENELIIDKMNLVLEGETKVNAFPILKSGKSRSTQIANRLAQLQKQLMDFEASLLPPAGQAELLQLKASAAELEKLLGGLPTSPEEVEARESEAKEAYKELSRILVVQERKVDQLQAKIVATELYIEGVVKAETGVVPQNYEAIKTELENQKLAIAGYRDDIAEIEDLIELGKAKVGVGDKDFETDELVRMQYEELVKEEHGLLMKYGVSGDTVKKLDGIFGQMEQIRTTLGAFNAKVETLALKKSQDIKADLESEKVKLQGYKNQLDELDGGAESGVGDIALMSFLEVKGKFGDLILKADVGIIDVAWSRKEEHRHRVQYLTSERLNKLQMLDDEFKEILLESGQEAGNPEETAE